jgi:hypothetical protein
MGLTLLVVVRRNNFSVTYTVITNKLHSDENFRSSMMEAGDFEIYDQPYLCQYQELSHK